MTQMFFSVLKRDLILGMRQSSDLYMILIFFVISAALFPLGVGPEPLILARIAPGIVWVLALFSILMSLDRLFHQDYEDGSLEIMLLSPYSSILFVLAKLSAYWVSASLPLIILAPIIAIMLQMDISALPVLILGLVLGTPILTLIGSIGAALSLGARRSGLLVALLILPLFVPVLIFGVSMIDASLHQLPTRPHILILTALLVAAIPLASWASAAALRQAVLNR